MSTPEETMTDPVTEKFQKLTEDLLEHVKASDKFQVAEIVGKVAADTRSEFDAQAENMETFIRSMSKIKIQFGLLGAAVGTAAGAMVAFAVAYRKAETKYRQIADDEIEEMRRHYKAKIVAAESQAQKLAPVKKIVAERGYSAPSDGPPMAVQPPDRVADSEDEAAGEPPDTEDQEPEPKVRNIFRDTKVDHEWDYHEELRRRSPEIPYVVHYDERRELEYQEVTLTYYEIDDVLCNERDEIIDPDKRDELVGDKNLERFGHGSNDPSIVYIRNDQLEILYEVVKSPNSYGEEVHGFSHEAYDRGNIERMRARERDEQDEG